MPRYRYYCEACDEEFVIFHRINDDVHNCPECEKETISKMLSIPVVIKKAEVEQLQVGDLTKEYIQANREILQQEKKNALKEEHE